MRLISGSQLNQHVERRWLETLFQMQGPDGLFYYPKHGITSQRLCSALGPDGLFYYPKHGRPWWQINHFGPPTPGDHYFSLYLGGRLLSAITAYHLRSQHPVWRETGRRYVDGLARLAMHKKDFAFFEWPQYGPGGSLPADFDPRFPPAYGMAFWVSSSIRALAQFGQATGYEPALVLARKLVRWVIDSSNYFGGDGTFVHEPAPPDATIAAVAGAGNEISSYAHFHGHTVTLLALLEFGLVAKDRTVLDFVLRGYRYGRSQGDLLTGFFPEVTGRASFEDCETCCVADMLSLALKLSAAGVADCWDDADRWLRNQFVENQLTETDWTWRFWETGSAHPRDFDLGAPSHFDPAHQTTDRALERHLGGFAAHASANDFSTGRTGLAACCTGNAARTLYHAWEHILHFADGKLRINLLLNRGSPWADVDSYIPYEGQVDVRVKRACDLAVRLPEWVRPEQAACRVNGAERALGWDGRYARLGPVEPGQVATLTFSDRGADGSRLHPEARVHAVAQRQRSGSHRSTRPVPATLPARSLPAPRGALAQHGAVRPGQTNCLVEAQRPTARSTT